MDLKQLADAIGKTEGMSHEQIAIWMLYYFHLQEDSEGKTASELAQLLREYALGSPNVTRLKNALRRNRFVQSSNGLFRVKRVFVESIRRQITPFLDHPPATIDHSLGFLPSPVWEKTRNYVERIAAQMNGCYQYGFYDGASVLMRRLLETLIIDAFKNLGREAEVFKSGTTEFVMLEELINLAIGPPGIGLGRESKKALPEIKRLGDRSAHNPRYNASKSDLDKAGPLVRVAMEELIVIANIRK